MSTEIERPSAHSTGILLVNIGTPDAPTPAALRRYLKEFLWDQRIVDWPRPLWWLVLNGIILNTRPRRSARLYARIWSDEGSPLLAIGRRQATALDALLRQHLGGGAPHVALGMRYGRPSIRAALEELRAQGCTRLVVLPLYPQYFDGTTGSTIDAVAAVLSTWRWVPELRTISGYHDDAGYIRALAESVRDLWAREGEAERLLLSFHGIPVRRQQAGDPYPDQCRETARLLSAELGLSPERCAIGFQSRFGREKWLAPFTDRILQAWGAAGVQSADILCPGFAADCLETLEEIAIRYRSYFLQAGGQRCRYIPALNDRPDHVRALADLALRQLQGWCSPGPMSNGARS